MPCLASGFRKRGEKKGPANEDLLTFLTKAGATKKKSPTGLK